MRNDKISPNFGTRAILGVGLFLAFGAGSSQAAISACTAVATGTVLTGLNGAGNGCSSIDLSFEDFTVSGASGTNGFVAPTLANTAVFATGTAPSGNTINPVTLTFNPSTAANWDALTSDAISGTLGATFSFVSNAHTGGSYPVADPGFAWYFDSVTLGASGAVGNTILQSITITQTLCLGVSNAASCSAANQGIITASFAVNSSLPTFACSESSSNLVCTGGGTPATSPTLDILNSSQFTQIYSSTTISASHFFFGNTVDLNSFNLQFAQIAETPEPSTLGLMGTSLMALCALARKRRKS